MKKKPISDLALNRAKIKMLKLGFWYEFAHAQHKEAMWKWIEKFIIEPNDMTWKVEEENQEVMGK